MNANRQKDHWIVRLYQTALRCFPEQYRREYADELLYAVRMAVDEAKAKGRTSLLLLAGRELRDLPLAIVSAHLKERRAPMKLQPGAHLPGGRIRSWQLGAVFLPFLLPLLYPFVNYIASKIPPVQMGLWVIAALRFLFMGLLVVIFIVGLVRSFPVWALPVLGIVLFIVSAIVQLNVQTAVFFSVMRPLYGGWPEVVAQKIGMMLMIQLVFLIVMVALLVGLMRIVPGFLSRVRQEWTLLSFLLYGMAIMPVLGNDEFRGVEGYEIISLMILAFGAGLYLIAPRRCQRVVVLVIPAVLSPAVMSLGLYQTFPAQSWADSVFSFRLWEALQPVLYLSPLPILMLLASLAPRLPWGAAGEPASSSAPIAP
jgi:hypothetical protein